MANREKRLKRAKLKAKNANIVKAKRQNKSSIKTQNEQVIKISSKQISFFESLSSYENKFECIPAIKSWVMEQALSIPQDLEAVVANVLALFMLWDASGEETAEKTELIYLSSELLESSEFHKWMSS